MNRDDVPIEFDVLGYGGTCSRCGCLVVGREAQDQHREYHRELDRSLGR